MNFWNFIIVPTIEPQLFFINFLAMKKFFFLALVALFVWACGDGPSSSSREKDYPEGIIYDTTYIDTSAYSFVYFSSRNKLDTVTALSGEMKCDIDDKYFSCHLTRTFSTCSVMYEYNTTTSTRQSTDSDSLIHKEVNVLQIDTTFINYGKRRLIDSIPPYTEQEKMNLKGLQDAFDTVELDLKDTSSYDKYYGGVVFKTPYVVDEDYGTLPDGAGAYTPSSTYYTEDADGDTVRNFTNIFPVSFCSKTVYIDYPLTPKIYEARLYMFRHDSLEKDTTVTWQAYYTDMYGVKDSVEITTVFKMKGGSSKSED